MAIGDLCYKKGYSPPSNAPLIYKKAGPDIGKLCYKGVPLGKIVITFSWPRDATDLDICAYWTSAPDLKVGFSYQSRGGDYSSGIYNISWGGDEQGTGATEHVEIWRTSNTTSTTFRVHFNFYGPSDSGICSVVATQANGNTFVQDNQPCGTTRRSPADTDDPGVQLNIDASGKLTGMTSF